ncbi:hypothetical protein Tco_1475145 [Tanacetum coccineum]
MDNPNITMEKYIMLEEEKARKRAFNDGVSSERTLSCEPVVSSLNDEIDFRISFDDSDGEDYTVIFDKNSFSYKIIPVNNMKTDSENDNEKVNMPSFPSPEPTVSCFNDSDSFKDFENEFRAIVYNDAPTSKSDLLTEPTLNPQNIDEFDSKDETSLSEYEDEEQNVLYFNDLFPFNFIQPDDLKSEKDNDDNEVDIIQSSGEQYGDIQKGGAQGACIRLDLMAEGLSARMLMEHMDAQGVRLFTSRAWRRLFDIRGLLLRGARRRLRWRQFILALGLHTNEEMETVRFGAYWAESARQIPNKGDLRDYWIGISYVGDFLGTASSYTSIRDPILKLCHRLIACSIARRSQAPEKVTVTDLFYLRGMEEERARLVKHFGLLTEERFWGLTVIAPTLPVIDMAELVRLQIFAQDAPVVDEGDQAVLAPVQAPPPPPATARTMPQRMAILEEDVHKIRGALAEQRKVIGAMARDFSRFTVWAASGIAQLLDSARVTYMPYYETRIPYQHRVR